MAGKLHADAEQELRHAAWRGDIGELVRLIESGASANSASKVSCVYSDGAQYVREDETGYPSSPERCAACYGPCHAST